MNNKRNSFTMEDFKVCAKTASMKRKRPEAIVRQVFGTVSRWRDYTHEAGIPFIWRDRVPNALRLQILQ
jgi:serine/threonine-protein kinase HipA